MRARAGRCGSLLSSPPVLRRVSGRRPVALPAGCARAGSRAGVRAGLSASECGAAQLAPRRAALAARTLALLGGCR